MKTLLKAAALAFFAVVLAGSALVALKLDTLLKEAITTFGPQVTQTTVEVGGLHVSPIMGSAKITDLAVGNPKGFSKANSFSAERIRASLRTKSLLTDTIVVDLVEVDGAKVNMEGKGADSNLTKIEQNANAFADSMQKKLGVASKPQAKPTKAAKPGKNLLIKKFVLKGAQATVRYGLLSGKALTVTLPDIELDDIGTANKGSAVSEIVSKVTKAVQESVVKTAAQPLKELTGGLTKQLGSQLKGLGGLFGNKKK